MLQHLRALACSAAILSAAAPAGAQIGSGGRMEQLWANNCANCHGAKGQGGGAGTKTILKRELFGPEHDRPFFDAIKDGVPDMGMAAFGETFSDKEVWGLVVHIRELQARAFRKAEGDPKAKDGVYTSKHARFSIETVIDSGLEIPWAVEFLPDGRMLVTERAGTLRIHSTGKPGGTLSEPVSGLPKIVHVGQGGLMDVALHPEFSTNGWVYLGYADALENTGGRMAPNMTRVVRGHIKDVDGKPTWTDNQDIFKAEDKHYLPSGLHFGNRIVFQKAPAGSKSAYYVYWSIGERGQGTHAQDLSRPNGKIHRLFDDGRVPDDNPFVGNPDAVRSIWSYGHRNPQGLVFDLEGRLWDTEHGPRGGDEINLIQKGGNYGWPLVAWSIDYSGESKWVPWTEDGKAPPPDGATIIQPVDRWMPSIGACGLDVVRGDAFPAWKGDLVAGGLSGVNVDRIRIQGGKSVEREELIRGLGRVRDVVTAPDGTIYVVLNDPDHVIRMVPAAGK